MGAEQSNTSLNIGDIGASGGGGMDTARMVGMGAAQRRTMVEAEGKKLPKHVKDMDSEQLGDLVASTLDFCVKHYGSIPTNQVLIKTAQSVLTGLDIEGELITREKEVAELVDLVLDDGEHQDATA
jgi:hypothetical protein